MTSGSVQKYGTLSLPELCALPIPSIMAPDAVLFLWATVPLLDQAFSVITAWGFKYKTCIFWKKQGRLGMGFWYRGQVEVCLFAVRGKVAPFKCAIPNIVEAPATGHSRKPEAMARLITLSTPTLPASPRVELFAREPFAAVPGWTYISSDNYDVRRSSVWQHLRGLGHAR
jgi:N6-adenosine-specific RNA methylase IME4